MLPEDPDLSWKPLEIGAGEAGIQSLRLSFDGHSLVFRPSYEVTPMKIGGMDAGLLQE